MAGRAGAARGRDGAIDPRGGAAVRQGTPRSPARASPVRAAHRGQDARQLSLARFPGRDFPEGEVHLLEARRSRHRGLVLGHELQADPLGLRRRGHRQPDQEPPPHHGPLAQRVAGAGAGGRIRADGRGPGGRGAEDDRLRAAWSGTRRACSFHESKRTVRTASLSQVRQPVYKKSVQRWKNYEAPLGELFKLLGE